MAGNGNQDNRGAGQGGAKGVSQRSRR
jgi:hypothetical protein